MHLTEEQLVMARAQVDELHDAIYVLACAVEDAERDRLALGARPSATELGELLDWLVENAKPLTSLQLRPQ